MSGQSNHRASFRHRNQMRRDQAAALSTNPTHSLIPPTLGIPPNITTPTTTITILPSSSSTPPAPTPTPEPITAPIPKHIADGIAAFLAKHEANPGQNACPEISVRPPKRPNFMETLIMGDLSHAISDWDPFPVKPEPPRPRYRSHPAHKAAAQKMVKMRVAEARFVEKCYGPEQAEDMWIAAALCARELAEIELAEAEEAAKAKEVEEAKLAAKLAAVKVEAGTEAERVRAAVKVVKSLDLDEGLVGHMPSSA